MYPLVTGKLSNETLLEWRKDPFYVSDDNIVVLIDALLSCRKQLKGKTNAISH